MLQGAVAIRPGVVNTLPLAMRDMWDMLSDRHSWPRRAGAGHQYVDKALHNHYPSRRRRTLQTGEDSLRSRPREANRNPPPDRTHFFDFFSGIYSLDILSGCYIVYKPLNAFTHLTYIT